MYADSISESMEKAISETERRRKIQNEYNIKNNIVPKTIIKEVHDAISNISDEEIVQNEKMSKKEKLELISRIEKEMMNAAKELDFEKATKLRDALFELKGSL